MFDFVLKMFDFAAVNQDPAAIPPRLVYSVPEMSADVNSSMITQQVFARKLSGGRIAVVLLNRGTDFAHMSVGWGQLGLAAGSSWSVHDVISQKSTGETVKAKYGANVQSHDVAFVVLSRAPAPPLLTSKTDDAANLTVLFAKGTEVGGVQYEGYRIPTITRLQNGSLYASAEARYGVDKGQKRKGQGKYPSALVSRLSYDAAGTRWSPIQAVAVGSGINFGNALPIADLVTGELFLFFCHNNKDLFLQSTKDGGGTWTAAQNVSATLKPDKGGPTSGWIGAGPSAGVQMPATGRLLGAVNSKNPKVNGTDSEYMVISDDHGATWRMSAFVPGGSSTGLGEASVTLTGQGDTSLALLIRASDKAQTTRHFASSSTDGGSSWAAAVPAMSASPSCADSVASVHNGSTIVGVSPFNDKGVRQNLTLWRASDGVSTWAAERTIYPYCAAYSSMSRGLSDGQLVLLFEGVFDDPKFACAHGGSSSYSIAVTKLAV